MKGRGDETYIRWLVVYNDFENTKSSGGKERNVQEMSNNGAKGEGDQGEGEGGGAEGNMEDRKLHMRQASEGRLRMRRARKRKARALTVFSSYSALFSYARRVRRSSSLSVSSHVRLCVIWMAPVVTGDRTYLRPPPQCLQDDASPGRCVRPLLPDEPIRFQERHLDYDKLVVHALVVSETSVVRREGDRLSGCPESKAT